MPNYEAALFVCVLSMLVAARNMQFIYSKLHFFIYHVNSNPSIYFEKHYVQTHIFYERFFHELEMCLYVSIIERPR